jgi:hypothetical protein
LLKLKVDRCVVVFFGSTNRRTSWCIQ